MTFDKKLRKLVVVSGERSREKNYWLNRLSGYEVKTVFPYDFSRDKAHDRRWENVEFKIENNLFSRLMAVSGKVDQAIFIILAAGLSVLMNKYTERTDIILGTTITRQDVEGEFINTVLPLRVRLDEGMTFKQLLMAITQVFTEALQHQNYPLETLLYQVDPNFSREDDYPLFDVVILLEDIHDKKYLEGVNANLVFSCRKVSRQEGSFDAVEGCLEYNALLYREATLKRLSAHYLYLMEEALFSENVPIGQLSILSELERKQLLEDFNDTESVFPADKTLHRLFEDQVNKTPASNALLGECCPGTLTYEELNVKANRAAAVLKEKGVGPGVIVGLLMERSVEMLAALLGVLKVGGAYLPIEPAYPQDRIHYMLLDSGANFLISMVSVFSRPGSGSGTSELMGPTALPELSELIDAVKGSEGIELVFIDKEMENRAVQPVPPVQLDQTHSHRLAYVIYTSGSTGSPKGVMVEHRGVVNMLVDRKSIYQMAVGDVALQLFSYAFDGFVTSLFTPLISGGAVVLLTESGIKDIGVIKKAISDYKVTHFIIVPQLFQGILENLTAEEGASLKVVTLAGDQVPGQLLEVTRESLPHLEITVEYGVTEVSVMSTVHRHQERCDRVSIGKPIGNTRVYILDTRQRLRPIGAAGELCIAGEGVARGYLNRPELTAERFVFPLKVDTDLYGLDERIYRTGDLARWLADGTIEFLGRIDHQVKIRGFRVEPGEIERCLSGVGGIGEVVVSAREDRRGDKYLCAYYVSNEVLALADLREHLAGELPDYMIPSYFVRLECLPLTSNGKLDRKALPEPEVQAGENYAAPRDEIEIKLVDIWSRVLDLPAERIGIDTNFFEIGGHSLNTINLTSEIHKVFHVKISLNEVFEKATIRLQAGYIKQERELTERLYDSIQPGEDREYYPLTPSQMGVFTAHLMDPTGISYNLPIITPMERIDKKKVHDIFSVLMQRHESLRTSFEMIGGEVVQRIHTRVDLEVEYYDYPGSSNGVETIIKNFVRPFDLSCPPLFRVALVEIGDEIAEQLLLTDIHHIITDAVSLDIQVKTILALREDRELPLLRLQYRDYCQWRAGENTRKAIEPQAEYWQKKFEGDIPQLNLPYDFPRPEIKNYQGNTINFVLQKEETAALRRLVMEEELTLFILLLAVFNVLLSKITRQEDIIVGTVVVGRRHSDLQQIVGLFVNQLVLRNFPREEKTFTQFLKEVKTSALEAFESQEYSFEDLLSCLPLPKDPSRHPLFDVLFSLHKLAGDYQKELHSRIGALMTKKYSYQSSTVKYDMVISCLEKEETLNLILEYATSLFKKDTMERFMEYFKEIIHQVLSNKHIQLKDIQLSHQLVDLESGHLKKELDEFEL